MIISSTPKLFSGSGIKLATYIAYKTFDHFKAGDIVELAYDSCCNPPMDRPWCLLCDGRTLWAADYPDLARKCKRTFMQRLRGVFTLPDLN